ncbi:Uncharacterized protein dnl_44840 [Desulfonema limicola]|uniref:Uncharacterized protein n=1 Tax=Desulfonema limicola TaxID=45656 RepID=A0A975BB51_9BACT|nr:Uncharacterized protein dnl_44840 [Desulfonema limicola]
MLFTEPGFTGLKDYQDCSSNPSCKSFNPVNPGSDPLIIRKFF